MPRLFYIIPGIFDPLQDARDWDYQAQAWFKGRFPDDAAAGFNYADGWLGATLALDGQAAKVADDLVAAQKAGMQPVVIGHSNGCRIALRALELAPELEDVELHLIAAAADDDCRANGLNQAANGGQLTIAVLYVSSADEVLGLPLVSYGDLGKVGPMNASPALLRMMKVVNADPPCGHNDWVGRDFEKTMGLIAGGAQ